MLATAEGWNDGFGPFFLQNVFFICIEGMKNRIWPSSYGFYPPKRDVFQLGVWCQNWGANVRIEVHRWNYNEIISFIYMKWSNVRIEVQMSELRWRDFTSIYRGSPPYTLSQNPDNRETGYSNVLDQPWTSVLSDLHLFTTEDNSHSVSFISDKFNTLEIQKVRVEMSLVPPP